ncbi:MAG: sigma-70 family RNA polymerase sigma factor [Muribaculaceae bacterium]|nr:sigma-70 family RNA polymerase sigma factor [Muribaculaceae bacterium]
MQYFEAPHILYDVKDSQHIDNIRLVELCKKGDKEAMNLLYTRFAPRMLSLIQRYVDDINDAQDILHDGFIIAFTRLDSLRDSERIDYWLATIMRNLSLKFLKSRDVAQLIDDLPDVEDPQLIENVVDFDILTSLIDSLPAGYKNVFRLAVFENKSHKEISQILGIAPNSSSSQLFRAKLQLRQLINNYKSRAGILMLLLALGVPAIYYIVRKDSEKEMNPPALSLVTSNSFAPVKSEDSKALRNKVANSTLSVTAIPARRRNNIANNVFSSKNMKKVPTSAPLSTDSCSAKDEVLTDSIVNDTPTGINYSVNFSENTSGENKDSLRYAEEYDFLYADLNYPLPISESPADNQWVASFSVNTGFNSQDLLANNGNLQGNNGIPGNNNGDGDNNWNGDSNGPVYWNPDDPEPGFNSTNDPDDDDGTDSSNDGKQSISRADIGGMRPKTPLKNQSHRNHLPISFAFTAQKNFNSTLGIETGLSYTYLHSTFEDSGFVTECHWHYLGIPVKLNLTFFSIPRIRIYGSLGGAFYYPVYASANEKWMVPALKTGKFHSHPVWSLGAGVGLSFNLSKKIDIYIEPTLQHYFTNKNDVPNLWTDQSWGFTFPIGIRFKW